MGPKSATPAPILIPRAAAPQLFQTFENDHTRRSLQSKGLLACILASEEAGSILLGEEPTVEARIRVRVTPRASRNEIASWQGDVLAVRVTAPPVDGKANAALERVLARALGLPKSAVRVVAGARGRTKTVAVAGAAKEDVLASLREAAAP